MNDKLDEARETLVKIRSLADRSPFMTHGGKYGQNFLHALMEILDSTDIGTIGEEDPKSEK